MTRFAVLVLVMLCAVRAAAADDGLAALVQTGDRGAAIEAIRNGADVNAPQGDGTTPLHWAVYRLDAELTALLLEHGADSSALNRYGSSPLAEAAKAANTELVEMLLEAGADAEAPNADGETVLMLAARSGALDAARLLIEHGADVNARERWRRQTALMWAADENDAAMARLLIEHGADVHVRAAAYDWPAQITSEPRAQYRPTGGHTPLLYAARAGCTGCADAMIEAGADPSRPNPDGMTPLIVAIDNQAFGTAKLLLERGANPHTWDWWGRTPLYVAVDMSTYRARQQEDEAAAGATTALDIVTMLLEAGVHPDPQLNMHRVGRGGNLSRFVDDLLTTGATPLLRAAIGHDIDAIRLLLAHGAAIDLPNVMGVTPFMAAAGMGVSQRDRRFATRPDEQARVIETLELLLDAGADIDKRVTDITSRTARIARTSTMTEREGQTALYGAIKFAWTDVVEFLIANGASVDVVDALGRSPVDAALGEIGGRDNTVSDEIAALRRNVRGDGA